MKGQRGSRDDTRDEDTTFLKAGHSPDILRKLRRMYWQVGDEADLHGLTVPEATEAVETFIAQARDRGVRCVRVIHGKGLRSAGGEPVLKRSIRRLLAARDDVVAFVEPPAAEGGSGAVLVLLRD